MSIEGLPIPHAAADEFRPFGDDRQGIGLFGQKTPKCRMVPTELMAATVAVLADTSPELLYFVNELFTCHLLESSVHDVAHKEEGPSFNTGLGGKNM